MEKRRDTCEHCRRWSKGYRLQGFKVPPFCSHHFHSQRGSDPACAQFEPKDED